MLIALKPFKLGINDFKRTPVRNKNSSHRFRSNQDAKGTRVKMTA
jgi:hypothetical protein